MASTRSSRRGAMASTAAGVGLGGLAMVFVARTLLRDRAEIGEAAAAASPGWLLAAIGLAVVGMTAIAIPWRRAIQILGDDLPARQVVARYYVGELGKYLPGGVWPIVGRGELARGGGVRRAAAYGSVALSLAALYLAAMFAVVLGLPVLLGGDGDNGSLLVLLVLPVGLVGLHPTALGWGLRVVQRLTGRAIDLVVPPWRTSLGLVARYLPAWMVIGVATWAVARALDPGAPPLEIAVAAILSWVVGFVLVPVPGGIGVREAVFVAAAGSLAPGIAAAVAVVARVTFVLVDVVGALIGSAVMRRSADPDRSGRAGPAGPPPTSGPAVS